VWHSTRAAFRYVGLTLRTACFSFISSNIAERQHAIEAYVPIISQPSQTQIAKNDFGLPSTAGFQLLFALKLSPVIFREYDQL
jgi:hypothetical protein